MSQPPPKPDNPSAETGRAGVASRPTGEPSAEEKEQFRQPTFWYNEKDREASFQIEDARWAKGEQIKDWLKLLLMVVMTIIWTLIVYLLEPGLR